MHFSVVHGGSRKAKKPAIALIAKNSGIEVSPQSAMLKRFSALVTAIRYSVAITAI